MTDSPFVGLLPFERDDPRFFGREDDISLIVANLFAAPLTLLYGPTGVGKTSVLQAGVLSRLGDDAETIVFSTWNVAGGVENALRKAIGTPDDATMAQAAVRLAQANKKSVIVILDQFEEYFLYHERGHPADAALAELMTQADAPVSVLLSMREDGLASLDRFEDSVPGLFESAMRFDHLTRDGAVAAIERPLARAGSEAGEGLTDAVLGEVRQPHDRYAAAYLQIIMERLWAEHGPLTPASLKALGGVSGILRVKVGEALGVMTEQQQDDAAMLFRYLVTASGAKIAYSPGDLEEIVELREGRIRDVLEALVARHPWLMRVIASPDGKAKHARYELVHDLLAEPVTRWRIDYYAGIERRSQLTRQGATFTELVRTHDVRDAEAHELGAAKSETEARYRAHRAAFQAGNGTIEHADWAGDGRAVAVTRAERGGRRALHYALAVEPGPRSVFASAAALAAKAPRALPRAEADGLIEALYRVLSMALRVPDDAERELAYVAGDFERAKAQAARSAYVSGLVGAALVALAAVVAYLVEVGNGGLGAAGRTAAIGIAFGAAGAAASALTRLTVERVDVVLPHGTDRLQALLLGAARPLLGALLGLAAAYALAAAASWDAGEHDVWLGLAAFAAGSAERLTANLALPRTK